MAWDDWIKRNASWTGLKNIAGSAIIKADPTPNNWIVGNALPWYQRNVVEPGASYITKPWQVMTSNASTGNKIGGLMNAVTPSSWVSHPAAQSIRTHSISPLKESYQGNVNRYRAWDSPWGLKGAAEIVADPLTWAGAGAVTGGMEAGIKGATKLATRAGATRTAEALGRAATGATKVTKIATALESHPIASAMHGPQNVERVLAEKAAQRAALRGATATGTMTTPAGLMDNVSLANKGTEMGGTKPLHEFVQPKIPPKTNPELHEFATPNRMPGEGITPTGPLGKKVTGQELREKFTNIIKDIDVASAHKSQAYLRSKALKERVSRSLSAEVGKTGEARVAASMAELKGQMPAMDFAPLRDAFHPDEVAELYDMAAHTFKTPQTHFDKVHTWEGLTDLLDNGKLPTEGVEKLFKEVYGEDFVQNLYKKAAELNKAKLSIAQVPGIVAREITSDMRIAQTIVDASNLLRQNIINTVSHPLKTAKGFGKAELSMFGRQDIADAAVRAFETHPNSHRMTFMKNMGKNVPYVSTGGSSIKAVKASEEFYEGGWLMHNIPGIKQVTEASERSFSTLGNISRKDKYFTMTDDWAKMYPDIDEGMRKAVETGGGLDPEIFYKDTATTARTAKALERLDQLGEWTNVTTGRGNLPKFLQKHAETLNVVMYASRLMAARVGYVPKGIVFSIKNPVIRKEFARELAGLTTFTLGTLYTCKALGAKVEMDPRSTDFGKIRVGDTRIDLMGGFQPYIRYTAQIMTGERKSASGRIYEASRGETFARFLRSKEAPMVGLIHDMWSGETFIGEDADLSSETLARTAYSKFTPLFIQDVIDAVKQEGPTGAALAVPAFFGAGATSYGPESYSTKELRNSVSQKAYGMDWETLGKTRGVLYQKQLEESDPALKKVVEEEQRKKLQEAGIPKTDWDRWFTSQNTIKTTTTKQLKDADSLLRAGQITPKEFRLRVDEIQSNARFAYDQMDIDPQYASVRGIINSPSPGAALTDQAYSEYLARVYDSTLTDASGKFDYAKAEQRKQEIKAKYGAGAYQYIQQRLTMNRDDTLSMTALRKARETLRPYWQIEDQAWAAYPQDKEINDQIKMLESTDPDAASRALKRYPRIVAVRKRIAQLKKQMRTTNKAVDAALVWYR